MPTEFRETAGKTTASLKKSVIQFKHPWILDKVVRISVAKLSKADQVDWQAKTQKLLDAAPRFRSAVPSGTPDKIVTLYFKGIDEASTLHLDLTKNPEITAIQLALTEPIYDELKKENQKLKAQLDTLVKAAGERTEEEHTTTLRQCWDRFQERFQCRKGSKPEERANVLRRIRQVLEPLGLDRNFASVEKAHIEKAIEDSVPKTDTERSKRTQDIKRFFAFLMRKKVSDGFGFLNNPAELIEYLGPKELQRRRRAKGMLRTAKPEAVMDNIEAPYWKALLATLCYAGLRLNEAAALTWDRVQWDQRIIAVLPNLTNPKQKSELSDRHVKPFKELWPILRAYETEKFNDHLVFPRFENHLESWFLMTKGNPKVNHLTRELKKVLRKAGLSAEEVMVPQRRARRYWETRMRAIGKTDMIEIMGGHTRQVGLDHYTDKLQVVLALEGDDF